MSGNELSFEHKILSLKLPPSFVNSMDHIAKSNGSFDSRSDVFREAWKDLQELPLGDLLDIKEYQLITCRFPKEDVKEITKIYEYSNVLRIAIFLFILKYKYEVIA